MADLKDMAYSLKGMHLGTPLTSRSPLARSAKFLLSLLKNAQANGEVNGLDKDELYVKNIVVQQAPKMR